MAVIAVCLTDEEVKKSVEEFCREHSHQFLPVEELSKFPQSFEKGKTPEIFVVEIPGVNFAIQDGLKKIKEGSEVSQMTIFTYVHDLDVKTEVMLRKLKISSFFTRSQGKEPLISGLVDHFHQQQLKAEAISRQEEENDKRLSEEIIEKGQEIDVAQLANQFDDMVSKQVGEEDYSTHYDLGQSYLEMGLFDNAIKSFTLASNHPSMSLKSCHMLGICYYRKGDMNKAVATLLKGFKSEGDKRERAGMGYELGKILAELGKVKDALQIFRFVDKIEPDFADVRDQISHLTGSG